MKRRKIRPDCRWTPPNTHTRSHLKSTIGKHGTQLEDTFFIRKCLCLWYQWKALSVSHRPTPYQGFFNYILIIPGAATSFRHPDLSASLVFVQQTRNAVDHLLPFPPKFRSCLLLMPVKLTKWPRLFKIWFRSVDMVVEESSDALQIKWRVIRKALTYWPMRKENKEKLHWWFE